jgi:hypothetical protein
MSDAHKDDSLGVFASTLHAEIIEDRDVLSRLAQGLATRSSATKGTGAWLSEKIARLKLADQGATAIGHSKLWNSWYSESVGSEHFGRRWMWLPGLTLRLAGADFAHLVARAEKQEAHVDDKRLEIAVRVFRKTG